MPKIEKETKKSKIVREINPFIKNLGVYIKHQGLEIELTLSDGEKILLKGNRKMVKNQIIQFSKKEKVEFRINVNDIRSADIYVI